MYLKSLNTRITALFSGLFVLCAFTLFAVSYLFLAASLRQERARSLQSELLGFWALYQTGGIELLREEISVRSGGEDSRRFLLRVAGKQNHTLFYYAPEEWASFSSSTLEGPDSTPSSEPMLRSSPDGKLTLEIVSLKLADGNFLQVARDAAFGQAILRRFQALSLVVVLPILVISLLGGFLFSSRALKPVHRLLEAVQAILTTGKMEPRRHARIPVKGTGDELDRLVILFNRMLERIDGLIQGMREALDGVAHDLRTPLTRLKAEADMALQKEGDPEALRQALARCLEETSKILTMLDTLMDVSEAETGTLRLQRRVMDLVPVVADLAELYRYAAEEKGLELTTDLPSAELPVSIDLNRFRQVLANLLDNAVKYTPRGGRIGVIAQARDGEAWVRVEDSGIGIAAEELENIWERLYRGDRSRGLPGLGLGLSLVKAIVKAHGGSVGVESVPGQGSRFWIRLSLPEGKTPEPPP